MASLSGNCLGSVLPIRAVDHCDTQAAADVVIALLMCFLLHQQRTEFRSTRNILTLMTAYAVNTGLATSVVAITSLILVRIILLSSDSKLLIRSLTDFYSSKPTESLPQYKPWLQ